MTSTGNRSGCASAQAVFGSTRERQVAVGSYTTSSAREAVVAQQIVRLVQPVLAERRRGRHVLHRRVADRPKGAEVRVVDAAAARRAGRPCSSSVRSVSGVAPTTNCMVMPDAPPGCSGSRRPAVGPRRRAPASTSARTRSRFVQRRRRGSSRARCAPGSAPQGASRLSDTRLASAVSRSICAGFGAGHELHVDVSREAVALAQQLERRDEIVHHLDRACSECRW